MTTVDTPGNRITHHDIALPSHPVSLSQDREWCVVDVGGEWRKIRFHDYDEIYAIPGLYETLFCDVLGCTSPKKIRELLQRCLNDAYLPAQELRVLDLGAGNGMVAEQLAELGARRIIGVDIIPEAADAARRDREDLYEDYLVTDMAEPSDRDETRIGALQPNCLTCVAALGFGDIPPAAFANAFNLVEPGGWVAFNIKSDFLGTDRRGGFASLIRRMVDDGLLTIRTGQQYKHRRATTGRPLFYNAFIGTKNADVPAGWTVH